MAAGLAPEELSSLKRRSIAAAVSRSPAAPELRRVQNDLARAVARVEADSYDRGVLDCLLEVLAAVTPSGAREGLASQVASFEPGSLPARLLLAIAGGVRGANADLADRLGTDPWQLSRAGRRLRDLGFAERVRAGRLNTWSLTDAGEQEARQLRGHRASAADLGP